MNLLADTEAGLERQLELLFNAGSVEVLLEDEKIALLVKDNELRVREGYDRGYPECDVSARRLNNFDFLLPAVFELES